MPLLKEQLYTIEDIYKLPNGERAEIIDGQIYYMAPPKFKHQKILNYINMKIYRYIEEHNGACEVVPAPFAVFLDNDEYTYVEPDISVICDKSKIDDNGCNGAPDWIVEIVSPSSKKLDYFIKLSKYREAGVREYWIVDPEKNQILAWNFEEDDVSSYSFADIIKAGIYEDLLIDFSQISLENM